MNDENDITSLKEAPEQTGLSLFCQIEKALQMESSSSSSENRKKKKKSKKSEATKFTNLAEDFPDYFKSTEPLQSNKNNKAKAQKENLEEIYEKKIVRELNLIKIQQNELENQKEYIRQQFELLNEEKRKQENYKIQLDKMELMFNEKKKKWKQEKQQFINRITELEKALLNTTTLCLSPRGNRFGTNSRPGSAYGDSQRLDTTISHLGRTTPNQTVLLSTMIENTSPNKNKQNSQKSKKKSSRKTSPKRSSKKSPQRVKVSTKKNTNDEIPFSKVERKKSRDSSPNKDTQNNPPEIQTNTPNQTKPPQKRKEKNIIVDQIPQAYYNVPLSQRRSSALNKNNGIYVDERYLTFHFKLGTPVDEEEDTKSGRKVLIYKDGSRATQYRNGTIKAKHGSSFYYFFTNGDVSQEFMDGFRSYKYNETGTIEITKSGHPKIIVFSNGQREKHYIDGRKLVQYPNGQIEEIKSNGDYLLYYPDGKIEKMIDGKVVVSFE